ncbi:MAG: hypothetical protein ACR2F6_05310 [Mycobacteriales bacterium]
MFGPATVGKKVTADISIGQGDEWLLNIDSYLDRSSDAIMGRDEGDIPATGWTSSGTRARGYSGIDSLVVAENGHVSNWGASVFGRRPGTNYVAWMGQSGWFRMALNCPEWKMCPV